MVGLAAARKKGWELRGEWGARALFVPAVIFFANAWDVACVCVCTVGELSIFTAMLLLLGMGGPSEQQYCCYNKNNKVRGRRPSRAVSPPPKFAEPKKKKTVLLLLVVVSL